MTENSVIHPTSLFQVMPPLSGDEYQELKNDIQVRGVMVPVEYDETGNVLDGHHRVKACQELGIKEWPSVIRLGMDEAAKRTHARKLNMARRHLTKEQRASLWVDMRKDGMSYRQIAEADKTASHQTIMRAVENSTVPNGTVELPTVIIGKDGKQRQATQPERPSMAQAVLSALTDEEQNAVEFVTASGEIFWKNDLEDDEDLPERPRIVSIQVAKPEQVTKVAAQAQSTIERASPGTVAKLAANDINLVQAQREVKEQAREQRREENRIIVQQTAPLADVKARFATIVIDPPWDWGDEGDVDQMGRARPDYATMPYEKMLELSVADRADTDCHLYLWITNRSLPKGFALLEAWGFRYITCLTWIKPSFGLGNYFRGQSEQVLFGVKGSQPLKRKDASTVFYAPRGLQGHSSKPIEFYDFVESCSPGPYLEIFSRQERNDWTAWGEVVA